MSAGTKPPLHLYCYRWLHAIGNASLGLLACARSSDALLHGLSIHTHCQQAHKRPCMYHIMTATGILLAHEGGLGGWAVGRLGIVSMFFLGGLCVHYVIGVATLLLLMTTARRSEHTCVRPIMGGGEWRQACKVQ